MTIPFTLCTLLAAAIASPDTVERPDVLFIAVDDLNDWTSTLGGHPQSKTPNFDALAGRGVLFTNAHCAAPACNPSRAALLSGRRPFSTGVYMNSQPWREPLKDVLTLPQFYMQAGYHVVAGGKIFHGGDNVQTGHWHERFSRGGDPRPPGGNVNKLDRAHFDWGPVDASNEEMGDHRLVTWAVDQLQKQQDKPLFLAVGFVKPHLPWYVPRPYFELFPVDQVQLPTVDSHDLDDVPKAGRRMANPDGDHKAVVDGDQWSYGVQGYLATIKFVDDQLGRLLEAVDQSGRKNLVIVLWGDHGWHLGEKLHWRKFSLWEEATRAPLLFVAPGLSQPGTRCDVPIDFMSIYPTLADLCSLPAPDHLESVSLRPLLEDPSVKWDRPALTTHGRGNHAVRDDRWRYIRYADGSEELYDHRNDSNEWTNLAGQPDLEDVKKRLGKWLPAEEAPNAPRMSRQELQKKRRRRDG